MELAKTDALTDTGHAAGPSARLLAMPVLRQVGLMLGLAMSVALGVAVVLWSQSPSYSLLYPNLAETDAAQVVDALDTSDIDYRIEDTSGALLVPSDQVHEARIKLASLGLPRSAVSGFELLDQDQGLGSSRFMERARYQRALEGELVRSIMALNAVRNARVHLAVPKQSVFVRDRKKPSASVVVDIYAGRALEKQQVEAIGHLVASSVPELEASRVTVIDQKGRVLSSAGSDRDLRLTSSQFEYTQRLEDHYARRIEEILTPIVGAERVRARVTADVDFTVTEQTLESFNPDLPAVRSEQLVEEQSRLQAVQGIPGALSNQPPGAGRAPEEEGGDGDAAAGSTSPLNTSKRSTRNFELDKTISHSRFSAGRLRRLSAAVVVDDRANVDSSGKVARVPLTGEELDRITGLVRQAVGFDPQRGDSVHVINASFQLPEAIEPLPEPPWWEQAWVWDLTKQILAGLLVVFLVFGVLRPGMRALVARIEPARSLEHPSGGEPGDLQMAGAAAGDSPQLPGAVENDQVNIEAEDYARLEGPAAYEQRLEVARRVVDHDPKRVAQLVKNWLAEDE